MPYHIIIISSSFRYKFEIFFKAKPHTQYPKHKTNNFLKILDTFLRFLTIYLLCTRVYVCDDHEMSVSNKKIVIIIIFPLFHFYLLIFPHNTKKPQIFKKNKSLLQKNYDRASTKNENTDYHNMRICKLRVFFITYSFQTIIVITSYLKRRKKFTYFIIFTPRLLNLRKNLIICMHHTKCAGMHKTVIFYWVVFWSVCLFAYLPHFIILC